jgi:hypothetical protein
MVPLSKFRCFPQTVFHPPIGMLDFVRLLLLGCSGGDFQLSVPDSEVSSSSLCRCPISAVRFTQFGFKSGPQALFIFPRIKSPASAVLVENNPPFASGQA